MLTFRTSFAAVFLLGVTLHCIAQQQPVPLKLSNSVPAQFEDGPPLGALRIVPGEIVYFSFVVENYKRSDVGKVQLTGHVQIFDPRGTPVSPAEEIPLVTTLSEEDTNWKARLRTQIALPPLALPGKYTVKFDATDELGRRSASGESSFQVDAKNVPSSTELVIRDLNFYRAQDDEAPLRTASYRPGDMVWVKFYITGYKYGEMNAIDTSYDVDLLAADGKSVMHQEDAAMEKSMAYYPQPYIPAAFNLTLKSTMAHSLYTLVITARDAMGNQTVTAKADFQVN
jgi:hypothetical protein